MNPQEVIILMVNFLSEACRCRWQYRMFIATLTTAVRAANFIWVSPWGQTALTLTVRVLARVFINARGSFPFSSRRVNYSPIILSRSLIPTLAMFAWSLTKQLKVLLLDYFVGQIVSNPLFYFFQFDNVLIPCAHFRLLFPLLPKLIHQAPLFQLLLKQILFQSIQLHL